MNPLTPANTPQGARAKARKRRWIPACAGMTMLLACLGLGSQAANLQDVAAVPHLDSRGQDGYRAFLAGEPHRAFAIAPGGGWGWSQGGANPEDAQSQALESCQAHARQRCVPYAVDRKVVFDAKSWSQLWRPYVTASQAREIPAGTARGLRFPDLAFTAPNGKAVQLSSLRGKVVVLHFWGTWCPTCRHELPQFEQLQKRFAGQRDIAFIYTQVREPAAAARQWLKQEKLSLPLHDSGSKGKQDSAFRLADGKTIKDRYIAPVFPTTYVLDRHGLVVFSLEGSAEDWGQYAPFLKDLLGHHP
jgi:thiol-disulfide isomerase/thioredoxin